MKRLLLFELLLIFLATTFESDSPPGWFQQVLPRSNVTVDDIYFSDSLNGWSTAHINPGFDTAFVFATTNEGSDWNVQFSLPLAVFNTIQFLDANIGYIAGGRGLAEVYKTTNNGLNWNIIGGSTAGLGTLEDMNFINRDTGWVCDNSLLGGGLARTTNGGISWELQLDETYRPTRVFFINKDTGWVGTSNANGRLLRTTNGGANWNLQYTINGAFETIFFINGRNGWIRAGTTNSIQYTTNGGFNWNDAQGDIIGGYDTHFINDSIGYSGTFSSFKILKSTNGGRNWGYQVTPILSGRQVETLRNDTSNGWAGQIMHTTDGGGNIILGIQQIGTEIPEVYKLYQNYPNPFNPKTIIRFQINRLTDVKIIVYDIQGKQISELVNQKQNVGIYETDFNANNLPSGVYFYSLIIDGITVDTKKMILIK